MSSIKDLLLVGAGVNGTGTANSVMKWLDADTATDSIIYDNGTNIGIGTSSPITKLQITTSSAGFTPSSNGDDLLVESSGNTGITIGAGTSNLSSLFFGRSGVVTAGAFIYDHSNNSLQVRTSATERMRIDSSGNVGIGGSTNASRKLEIVQDSGQVAGVRVNNAGSGAYYQMFSGTANPRIGVSANTDQIEFHTNAGEKMRITSAGNVGIGTSSPNYKVHAYGTSSVVTIATETTSTYAVNKLKNSTREFDIALDGSGFYLYDITANTERMRIDASGYVGIGTTAPSTYDQYGDNLVVASATHTGITIAAGTTSQSTLMFADGTGGTAAYRGRVGYDHNTDSMFLHTAAAERIRISSDGQLLIGRTTTISSAFKGVVEHNSGTGGLMFKMYGTGTEYPIRFLNNSTATVGNIITTNTSTSYNTSSDHRLKENVVPIDSALDRIDLLKPSRFNFIANPETTVDGFLAHEVQEVVPEAITGEKDAVDEEGNPVYQGIDQSKLVPLLTAAIQELRAEIETLKSQING